MKIEPSTVARLDYPFLGIVGVSEGTATVSATARDEGAVVSNSLVIRVVANPSTGIDKNASRDLSIYPIPASSILNIQLNDNFLGETLRISDISGREVLNALAEKSLIAIDVSELNEGIYILSIKSGHASAVQRIVIE